MTIKELHSKLDKHGIDPESYYLHGLYGSSSDDEKLALIIRKGKYTIEYETYYRERGEKHSIRIFSDENIVCDWILNKLTNQLK